MHVLCGMGPLTTIFCASPAIRARARVCPNCAGMDDRVDDPMPKVAACGLREGGRMICDKGARTTKGAPRARPSRGTDGGLRLGLWLARKVIPSPLQRVPARDAERDTTATNAMRATRGQVTTTRPRIEVCGPDGEKATDVR